MAGRSRSGRRRALVVVLLLGGAAWYLWSRLTEVREPWSSVPMPGDPGASEYPSPASAAWAEPDRQV